MNAFFALQKIVPPIISLSCPEGQGDCRRFAQNARIGLSARDSALFGGNGGNNARFRIAAFCFASLRLPIGWVQSAATRGDKSLKKSLFQAKMRELAHPKFRGNYHLPCLFLPAKLYCQQ